VHIIQINPTSELIEEVQDFLTPDEMASSAIYEWHARYHLNV